MTPAELAARWHTSEKALANRRSLGTGLRFSKDPETGRIYYLRSDVLEAEVSHGFTWERATPVLEAAFRETFPEMTERQIKRVIAKPQAAAQLAQRPVSRGTSWGTSVKRKFRSWLKKTPIFPCKTVVPRGGIEPPTP